MTTANHSGLVLLDLASFHRILMALADDPPARIFKLTDLASGKSPSYLHDAPLPRGKVRDPRSVTLADSTKNPKRSCCG